MTAKKGSREPAFEEDLARLEALATKMEQGNLPLDELMEAYEEGSALSKTLQERLERAKARLSEVKVKKDGSVTVAPSTVAVQGTLLDDLEK